MAAPKEDRARRVTSSDIARRAGVSKGAVSFALNERPGLSDSTRARILAIAEEMGWYPNSAARALSVARAHACGLVLARTLTTLSLEPFFMEFIAGVESELSSRSIALTIQMAEDVDKELSIHRRWWAERRVDGVLMVDLRKNDPRVEGLARLGMPAVVVGGPLKNSALPCVWHDEASVIGEIVEHLAGLGHRRIARVAGLASFVHSAARNNAFRQKARALSLSAEIASTDFSPESGADATRRLLSGAEPPTAIVYDSDVLAVSGLGMVHELGLSVPGDVSIVAGDDSLLCQVVGPPLTAVERDIPAYGVAATRRLLDAIDENAVGDIQVPRGRLTVRGSTARPRRRRIRV